MHPDKKSWTSTLQTGRRDVVSPASYSSRYRTYIIVCSITALAIWVSCHALFPVLTAISPFHPPSHQSPKDDAARHPSKPTEFRWSDIEPSPKLQYSPCFGSFQCARLSVPLNWNASSLSDDSPRAAVAVIKLPAKVPVTDPRYAGPVITNPGGPGESGVYQVLAEGRHLQTIVDSPGEAGRYFDILSFDPRGVNNTTPPLRCFPDAFNRQAWNLQYLDYGLLWSSESVVGQEWARASALGASCARGEGEGGDGEGILRYANTAQVVGDMVAIIEREGEWRAAEAEKLVTESHLADDEDLQNEIIQRTAYRPGGEKLQYWGMSYGTLIGSTFAALHPDKVGRVVLDGVVDPADHYAGAWLTQLFDSDKVVTKFSEYCFRAGAEKCPLYTGPSPAAVEDRFTGILMSLKDNPIPVVPPGAGPEIITYGDVHLYLLSSIYFSFATAETFWDMLAALESRNATAPALVDMALQKQARLVPDPTCHDENESKSQQLPRPPCVLSYNSMLGPNQAIGAMDINGTPASLNRTSFAAYLSELGSQSKWVSPSWARNKLSSLGYGSVRPAWRPNPFSSTSSRYNTSHPLLIIGNAHDPVTPLRNALRVSREIFPGSSAVLRQDSEGHCSQSNPSLCTARIVRAYFQTGALPAADTVCEPETKPFVGCIQDHGCVFDEGSEDGALWESMTFLADPFGLRRKDKDSVGSEGALSLFEDWDRAFDRRRVLFP
ncbi:hypothetical protein KJ359_013322 [Pestalotiopsis sp. 9143b]|nr:hypothetical protein KJ359_013322 [Pestalotiopsis sp. 9143b]